MQFPYLLGGCSLVSGWSVPAARDALWSSQNYCSNALICHGSDDDQVALECAELIANAWCRGGAAVRLQVFTGLDHEPCADEVDMIEDVLQITLVGRGDSQPEYQTCSPWQ